MEKKPTDPDTPVEPEIDYSALIAEIAKIEAENLDATLYTTETWMNLQNALSAAKALINNAENQDAVSNALNNLKSARAALTLKPVDPDKPVIDYSALENEIAKIEAEGLKAEDYTVDSWSAFKTAMDEAKALIGKALDQNAVDNALAKLKAAYESLEKKPTDPDNPDDPQKPDDPKPTIADYTALNEAIAKAKELKEEDYTASSWLAFQKALANAEKALESNDQAVVDEATAALNAAIEALEAKKQNSLLWLWILLIILAILLTAGIVILILFIQKKKKTQDSIPDVSYNIADDDVVDAEATDAEATDAETEEAEAEEAEAEEAEAEEAEAEEAEAEEAEADEAEAENND